MANVINPSQDPNYQLFKYSGNASIKITPEVQMGVEDLVRTGFKDKYNELAQSVIYNIYSKFTDGTSGQQTLVFETSKGEFEIAIVGAGVVQGIGIITADSVIYNATVGVNNITNVQQALDLLLYNPPTISAISGGWNGTYFEIGVNPITSDASVTGNKTINNLSILNLSLIRTDTGTPGPSSSITPSPANSIHITTAVTAVQMSAFLNTYLSLPSTYMLNASIYDNHIPSNNGSNVSSSKFMQFVLPMIYGSSTYDSYTNSVSNVQTTFNTTFLPSSVTSLSSNYSIVGISVPFYRDIRPKQSNVVVIHSNASFTNFLFPKNYYSSIANLISSFQLQDGSTNLVYPYDFDTSIIGGFQDVNSEWRIKELVLNFGSQWNTQHFYLITSKVPKPKLTLKYNF